MGRMTAAWAISRLESMSGTLSSFPASVADSCGGDLGYEVVVVEALELERLDQIRSLTGRDQLGERHARDRRGLEPVGPPAAVDEEAVDLGQAHDRAVVRAHVAETRPVAEDLRRVQLREQLEHVPG